MNLLTMEHITKSYTDRILLDDVGFSINENEKIGVIGINGMGKLALVERAHEAQVPIICSMGTGNKLDPAAFQVEDISKTSMCPLARIMRKELKKRGINHVKVVYSQEEALTPAVDPEELERTGKRQIPGSTAFVPGAAGLILAGEVIRDLIKE